jgi:hypothetical protein
MAISFIRPAVHSLVMLAAVAPDSVFRALTGVASERPRRPVGDLDEIHFWRMDEPRSYSVAFSYSKDTHIVLDVGRDLTPEHVRSFARRLTKLNWRDHLITLDLDHLSPLEMRALLNESLSVSELDPGSTRSLGAVTRSDMLTFIEEQAHRWRTGGARMNFKGLLEAAELRPQIVERPGGEEVFVLGRGVLASLTKPRSALDIVAAFAADPMPLPALRLSPRPAAPPALRIGAAAHRPATSDQ